MNLLSFIHPVRTFLPCSGAGRFINNTLLELAARDNVDLQLLFAAEWLGQEGILPENTPLRDLPFRTFPGRENQRERLWKLIQRPKMDHYVSEETDWVYCPMETMFPLQKKTPVAFTVYDIQAFEPGLPWSHTFTHRRFAWKWGRWMRTAIDRSRLVFTISEFTKARMVELLEVPSEKIVNVGCRVRALFAGCRRSFHLKPPISA